MSNVKFPDTKWDKPPAEYYGVSQFAGDVEYQFIFDKETIKKNLFPNESLPRKYKFVKTNWPVPFATGPACVKSLYNDDQIYWYLADEPMGPDISNPTLAEIGRYDRIISNRYGSCTEKFMNQFELPYITAEDDVFNDVYSIRSDILIMVEKLNEKAPDEIQKLGIDPDDPLYGTGSENVHLSDLDKVYKTYFK